MKGFLHWVTRGHFLGSHQKILPLGSTLNFDADVKKTTNVLCRTCPGPGLGFDRLRYGRHDGAIARPARAHVASHPSLNFCASNFYPLLRTKIPLEKRIWAKFLHLDSSRVKQNLDVRITCLETSSVQIIFLWLLSHPFRNATFSRNA